jgi:riboflavin synthase
MFSGIVESLGSVEELRKQPGGARLRLKPGSPMGEAWMLGESVCVSGACLTLAAEKDGILEFDLGEETLRRTSLGSLQSGSSVNLERALKLGERLGGHFVAGHVDGLGSLKARRPSGESAEFDILAPPELMKLVAGKGSVAVEGVSLTPFQVAADSFTVSLIPLTLQKTNLGVKKPGDALNLEADLLARYVSRLMEGR